MHKTSPAFVRVHMIMMAMDGNTKIKITYLYTLLLCGACVAYRVTCDV